MKDKDVTTRRSGEPLRNGEDMLRALVESYDKVLEAAHKQPNNSTAPFMRAHRQFEELMRQARAALPVRTPAPATPGHWLGCSLPPEHTGDCLVPRSRR